MANVATAAFAAVTTLMITWNRKRPLFRRGLNVYWKEQFELTSCYIRRLLISKPLEKRDFFILQTILWRCAEKESSYLPLGVEVIIIRRIM